jgi:hypothetical protein
MKAFYTFKRDGIEFLMIPQGHSCVICDSDGTSYGAYYDQKSFEFMAKKEGGFDKLKLGVCRVQLEHYVPHGS